MAEEEQEQLDETELEARLAEELHKLKIQDILLQTTFTLASLGFHRLGEEDRDVEQGRLAIEALLALLPVLREAVPPSVTRDLNQTIANLYEVQVRKSNISAEHHHRRSQRFFFGMLAAQTGVIISTLAMAAKNRNLLWSIAAVAGLLAVAFAVYVFLYV